jgi:hypothetical protein
VNRILLSILAIALLVGGCAAPSGEGLDVRDAWTRPAAQGGNGAVYFVIENHSSETQEMIGVEADIAEAVEMHQSQMSGDVMEMHQMESVSVEPGAKLNFEPGGLHVMLIGLKKELRLGEEIELTLHFANDREIQVIVPVQDTPASQTDHS